MAMTAIPGKTKAARKSLPPIEKTFWTFRGHNMTVTDGKDGSSETRNQGRFSLSRQGDRRCFDYTTDPKDGKQIAFSGIYELESDKLRVCYGIRMDPPSQPPDSRRPDSFEVAGEGFRRFLIEFERDGN
jgi:uncharacterized protein (TIGR03067 family)